MRSLLYKTCYFEQILTQLSIIDCLDIFLVGLLDATFDKVEFFLVSVNVLAYKD
jgi:hypothetical protein